MKTKLSIFLTLAVLAVVVSGCGGSGAGYPTQSEVKIATPSPATGSTASTQQQSNSKPGKPPKVTGKVRRPSRRSRRPAASRRRSSSSRTSRSAPARPRRTASTVTVNYVGDNWDNGSEFDTSFGKQPFTFAARRRQRHPGVGPRRQGHEGRRTPAAGDPARPRLRRAGPGLVRSRRTRRSSSSSTSRRSRANDGILVRRTHASHEGRECVGGARRIALACAHTAQRQAAHQGDDGRRVTCTARERRAPPAPRRQNRHTPRNSAATRPEARCRARPGGAARARRSAPAAATCRRRYARSQCATSPVVACPARRLVRDRVAPGDLFAHVKQEHSRIISVWLGKW